MEVILRNGYTTLIDEADWFGNNLFLLPWYGAKMSMGRIYVIAKVRDPVTGRQRALRLHRVVMDAPRGKDVDHISGSGIFRPLLDCEPLSEKALLLPIRSCQCP